LLRCPCIETGFIQMDAATRDFPNHRSDHGSLLGSFRADLLAVARREIAAPLRSKIDEADVVQQTLLDAHASFAEFGGGSRVQLRGWLLTILRNNLANFRRHYACRKRCIMREHPLDESSRGAANGLVQEWTPAHEAGRLEEVDWLRRALSRLPASQRQVIDLYYWQGLSW